MTSRIHRLIAAAAAPVLCIASPVSANEADVESVSTTSAAGVPVCVHDNGDTDQVNGFSNRAEGVGGDRRRVLDDFTVPDGETWRVTGLRHLHVWDTLTPPAGTGMEIDLRSDDNGQPGPMLQTLTVTDYSEIHTERLAFGLPEAESWTTIEPIELPTGTYWFEANIVGPENNFWMTAPVQGNECWVNYGVLRPSTELPPIGTPSDLSWCISGEVLVSCPADLDTNGTVDFVDLLLVLGNWGPCEDPCPPHCAYDIDDDCQVAFTDILAILGSWVRVAEG